MAAITLSDTAAAAGQLSVPPPLWPPTAPTLMVAIVPLRQNSGSSYLAALTPGALFWAAPLDAPTLLAAGMAVIAPQGSTLAPEPAWTVHGVPGFGIGTSNCSH